MGARQEREGQQCERRAEKLLACSTLEQRRGSWEQRGNEKGAGRQRGQKRQEEGGRGRGGAEQGHVSISGEL